MAKRSALLGNVYHFLTVIKQLSPVGGHSRWLCLCACRTEVSVFGRSLISGGTKSCGCYHAQRTSEARRTHGESTPHSVEYGAWAGAISRCTNKKAQKYKYYGGRGIKVCARWRKSFANFLEDMGRRPGPNYSIDRINNDGNYEPSNCRWATASVQNLNRRKL